MDEKLKYIWKKIADENIIVKYKNIRQTKEKLNGVYVSREDAGPLIILDTSLLRKPREHRCILAHEVGHYFTGAKTNILHASKSYTAEIERSRDEYRAMRWATSILMPDREIHSAVHELGIVNCYELAEHFDVTIQFCMSKLTYIKQCFWKIGTRVKGRDIFTFEVVSCRDIPAELSNKIDTRNG